MFSRLSKKHSRQLAELRKALDLRSTQAALEFAIEQTAASLWSSDSTRDEDADTPSSAASQSATWKVTGGPVVDDGEADDGDDEVSERET